MKLRRFLFAFLLSLAAFQFCFSQVKPKAVLFDKFNQVVLGELLARIDGFLQELEQKPDLQGYVVIYPEKNPVTQDFKYYKRYANQINNRIYQQSAVDESRIFIVRSKEKDTVEVELWKVPADAEKPFSIEDKFSPPLPDITKAFVFDAIYLEESYPTFAPKLYANLINNNQNLRGHIVAHGYSKKYALKQAEEWAKLLTDNYKIPHNCLKVFSKKTKSNNYYVEFWLVPQKKK